MDYNPDDMYVEWSGDFLQNSLPLPAQAGQKLHHTPLAKSIDTLPALLYKCYTAIKGGSPSTTSWTLTERSVAGLFSNL